jgi:hypothetical protein
LLGLHDGQRSMQSVGHQARRVWAGTAVRKTKTRKFKSVNLTLLSVMFKKGCDLGG